MRPSRFVVLHPCGLLIFLSGCAVPAVEGEPGIVPGLGGLVVTLPRSAATPLLQPGWRAVVPAPEVIVSIEANLARALRAVRAAPRRFLPKDADAFAERWLTARVAEIQAQLPSYRRQYVGWTDSQGKQRIYLNSLRFRSDPGSTAAEEPEGWTETLILVDDGGSDFWQAEFGGPAMQLREIRVNGDGEP